VRARYDGVAEWYDRELGLSETGASARRLAVTLLHAGYRETGWKIEAPGIWSEGLLARL
jgi:hypothetical protein